MESSQFRIEFNVAIDSVLQLEVIDFVAPVPLAFNDVDLCRWLPTALEGLCFVELMPTEPVPDAKSLLEKASIDAAKASTRAKITRVDQWSPTRPTVLGEGSSGAGVPTKPVS
jgi:hypothetical protein